MEESISDRVVNHSVVEVDQRMVIRVLVVGLQSSLSRSTLSSFRVEVLQSDVVVFCSSREFTTTSEKWQHE